MIHSSCSPASIVWPQSLVSCMLAYACPWHTTVHHKLTAKRHSFASTTNFVTTLRHSFSRGTLGRFASWRAKIAHLFSFLLISPPHTSWLESMISFREGICLRHFRNSFFSMNCHVFATIEFAVWTHAVILQLANAWARHCPVGVVKSESKC